MSVVLAVHDWATNGALIADVATLHLGDVRTMLDATYGRGRWWTEWQPPKLYTNDLHTDAEFSYDFRRMPFRDGEFDAVAYDPPYKLNGTPALGDFDDAYGIGQPTDWRDRMTLIFDGLEECLRIASMVVLVKCQDQVCSGRIRWQTVEVTNRAAGLGWRLVDRFDMLGGSRSQPGGRRQVHARNRPSTLLVFRPAVPSLPGDTR
jgi:hypothetical protein